MRIQDLIATNIGISLIIVIAGIGVALWRRRRANAPMSDDYSVDPSKQKVDWVKLYRTHKVGVSQDYDNICITKIPSFCIDHSDAEYYKHIDWKGDEVDHIISWDVFYNDFLSRCIDHCHDFTMEGFLYDESGSMGRDNTKVGFRTYTDFMKYQLWFRRIVDQHKKVIDYNSVRR